MPNACKECRFYGRIFLSIHAATRTVRSVPTNSHYRIGQQSRGRRRNFVMKPLSIIEVFIKGVAYLLNIRRLQKNDELFINRIALNNKCPISMHP